jgi:hypothetical protein
VGACTLYPMITVLGILVEMLVIALHYHLTFLLKEPFLYAVAFSVTKNLLMLFITVKHNTEVNYPDYRVSLLHNCFRQHVSAVKESSSGLYRASRVKYNELGTQ